MNLKPINFRFTPEIEPGTELWTISNGEPCKRYYVKPWNDGHVLSHTPNLNNGHFTSFPLYWENKAAALLWMIEDLETKLSHTLAELRSRRTQLEVALS